MTTTIADILAANAALDTMDVAPLVISEFEIDQLSDRVAVILTNGQRIEPGAEWFATHCNTYAGDVYDGPGSDTR